MLLTVPEAAAALRLHPETIRRLIRRGDLAATKFGNVWRVPASAVEHHDPPPPKQRRPRQPTGELSRRVRAMNRGTA